jgi:hypothetical protein
MIAARYVNDAPAFEGWRPLACADLDTARARRSRTSTACGGSTSKS